MSTAVATINSPDALRKHAELMRHYVPEIEDAGGDFSEYGRFTEDQCADHLFNEPVMAVKKWAATLIFERHNPNEPKVKIL